MEFSERATGTSSPSANNSGQKGRSRARKKLGKSGGDIGRLFAAGARNMPRAEIARLSRRRV